MGGVADQPVGPNQLRSKLESCRLKHDELRPDMQRGVRRGELGSQLRQRPVAIVAAVREISPWPLDAEPFALSAPGVLDALVVQAGLTVLGGGTVACPCEYPDRETAWQAQASAGPLQAALRVVGAAQLKAAVLRALAPHATNTGVRLENHLRYVTATPDDDGCPTR